MRKKKFRIAKAFNRLIDDYLTTILLKNIKPVNITNSEYIFIFNQVKSSFAEKLYILLAHGFAERGIASCFLYKKDLLAPYFPKFSIDGWEISSSFTVQQKRFVKSKRGDSLFFEWTTQIENQKIEAEGINFFNIINNTLREIQKRYNVIYYDDNNEPVFLGLIQSCDLLLKYFLLLKNYANRNHKQIRLVGWEIDYIPNGVFRILCDQLSHNRDIEFIELERGYMNYFGYSLKESYISCSNLTKTKSLYNWAVSKDELAELDDRHIDSDELLKPVSNAVEKYSFNEIPENQKQIIKTIEDYKSQGKKIFTLFAHLFYDTPVDDKSPVFNGMCEWITETIRFFNTEEHLLLIKPHPDEYREEFSKKTPNETLASFLSDIELPGNIILLAPHLFTVKDLIPHISCGLIWRSSVAMELAFFGIPCIVAGNPYYNVLDFNFAQNKEQYFHTIKNSNELSVSDEQKILVGRYLYLLEKKHVHIDSIIYDSRLRKFYWNREALKKYQNNGDEQIRSVVENMLV
jgi:hypothetical protein